MAIYGIETTKSLYMYDPSNLTEHETMLNRSILGAKSIFNNTLSESLIYFYENVTNPIDIESVNGYEITVLQSNFIINTMRIQIGTSTYLIDSITPDDTNDTYIIKLNKLPPDDSETFTCYLLNELELVWGYCVLEQFIQTGKELVLRDIEVSKDRYVDGSLIPADRNAIRKILEDIRAKRSMIMSGIRKYTGIYDGMGDLERW